jgi:hypothetical protein
VTIDGTGSLVGIIARSAGSIAWSVMQQRPFKTKVVKDVNSL